MRIHADYVRFATATDAARIAICLATELPRHRDGINLAGLRVTRVLPRKTGGFTIQYQIPVDTGEQLYLGGHLLGRDESMPDDVAANGDEVIRIARLRLILPVFPFDPKLPALPAICSPAGAATLLAYGAPTPDPDRVPPARATVLAYRLEKRCVFHCEPEEPSGADCPERGVIVKAVRQSRLGGIVAGHEELRAATRDAGVDGEFTVPRILHVDQQQGIYVMEHVRGASLHALIGATALADAFASAGRALRILHGLRPPQDRRRTSDDEVAQLDTWTSRIGPMFPDVAARFMTCARRIRSSMEAAGLADAPAACVHGDFYDKQVLFARRRTTILDTDSLAGGDPAQDCGNFAAHVRLRQLQYPHHSAGLATSLMSFQDGYGEVDRDFRQRMTWWRSATLLRLAALYVLRPRWRLLVPTLLEEIDACMRSTTTTR